MGFIVGFESFFEVYETLKESDTNSVIHQTIKKM